MDMNELVRRKIMARKKYRRKVVITVTLGIAFCLLVLIGLIKVIMDEKKAEECIGENSTNISGQITSVSAKEPDLTTEKPESTTPMNEEREEPSQPTVTPTATPTPTPTPIPKKKVAVDPGHGGDEDFGCSRDGEGLYEKNANLDIALYLKEQLLNRGYDVYMIREADEAVENKERPGMAKENGADIYVSIHLNSLNQDSDGTRGAETWYYKMCDDGSDVLAQYVVDELTKVIETRNRGIKPSEDLIVLKYNELPACLVECGFMSSATERAKLFDAEYQKKIAEGIANGIEKFLPAE